MLIQHGGLQDLAKDVDVIADIILHPDSTCSRLSPIPGTSRVAIQSGSGSAPSFVLIVP
jgi:hypothetical protein